MVKKKGGREMNPADAFRKTQRAKEIARNKKERKFQRDAHTLKEDPTKIKDELKEVLDMEEDGKMNLTLRLKKRALQTAYDVAIKKQKEEQARAKQEQEVVFANEYGHGVPERRPEESVYYHPTMNPQGIPPPGKPQRYRTTPYDPAQPSSLTVPVPKPPPLPAGPAPNAILPPPPGAPPLLAGPGPAGFGAADTTLPPPPGPPPGIAPVDGHVPLPPPAGPPPGLAAGGPQPVAAAPGGAVPPGMPLPPPAGMPPPAMVPVAHLPPPVMPPPGFAAGPLPPPAGPPPAAERGHAARTTIQASSTVVKMPRAQNDPTVTAMVPASVRVRREAAPTKPSIGRGGKFPVVGPGFGLAPSIAPLASSSALRKPFGMPSPAATAGFKGSAAAPRPAVPSETGTSEIDKTYQAFLSDMAQLGAL